MSELLIQFHDAGRTTVLKKDTSGLATTATLADVRLLLNGTQELAGKEYRFVGAHGPGGARRAISVDAEGSFPLSADRSLVVASLESLVEDHVLLGVDGAIRNPAPSWRGTLELLVGREAKSGLRVNPTEQLSTVLQSVGFPQALNEDLLPVDRPAVRLLSADLGPPSGTSPLTVVNDHRLASQSETFSSRSAVSRYKATSSYTLSNQGSTHPTATPGGISTSQNHHQRRGKDRTDALNVSSLRYFSQLTMLHQASVRIDPTQLALDDGFVSRLEEASKKGKAALLSLFQREGQMIPLTYQLGARMTSSGNWSSQEGSVSQMHSVFKSASHDLTTNYLTQRSNSRQVTESDNSSGTTTKYSENSSRLKLELLGGDEAEMHGGREWLKSIRMENWAIIGYGDDLMHVLDLLPSEKAELKARCESVLSRPFFEDLGIDVPQHWSGLPAEEVLYTSGRSSGWLLVSPPTATARKGLFLTEEGQLALVDTDGYLSWSSTGALPGNRHPTLAFVDGAVTVRAEDGRGATVELLRIPVPSSFTAPTSAALVTAQTAAQAALQTLNDAGMLVEAKRGAVNQLAESAARVQAAQRTRQTNIEKASATLSFCDAELPAIQARLTAALTTLERLQAEQTAAATQQSIAAKAQPGPALNTDTAQKALVTARTAYVDKVVAKLKCDDDVEKADAVYQASPNSTNLTALNTAKTAATTAQTAVTTALAAVTTADTAWKTALRYSKRADASLADANRALEVVTAAVVDATAKVDALRVEKRTAEDLQTANRTLKSVETEALSIVAAELTKLKTALDAARASLAVAEDAMVPLKTASDTAAQTASALAVATTPTSLVLGTDGSLLVELGGRSYPWSATELKAHPEIV